MKRILLLGFVMLLGSAFLGCGTMNTRFRPYVEQKQEVQNLKAIVTRADRSGIYLALKNVSEKDMEIIWKDSTLGNDEISQGTYIDMQDYKMEQKNKTLISGEIFQTVLHRKNDIYYLDPVLYQPGGVKIRSLHYPVILKLKVKEGTVESILELEIQQEESLYEKDVEARTKTKHLIPEFMDEMLELREDKKVIKRANQS